MIQCMYNNTKQYETRNKSVQQFSTLKYSKADRLHWLPVAQRIQFKLSDDVQSDERTDSPALSIPFPSTPVPSLHLHSRPLPSHTLLSLPPPFR